MSIGNGIRVGWGRITTASGRFPLLLDNYPGAVAAYSLRKINSTTTNVVKVRRDSDNTERDFTADEVINGALLSWVGTSGTDNGFVTTWYDQSGNNNNATQATASDQPKIVDAGVLIEENNKPALTFSQVSPRTHLNFTPLTNSTDYSFYSVVRISDAVYDAAASYGGLIGSNRGFMYNFNFGSHGYGYRAGSNYNNLITKNDNLKSQRLLSQYVDATTGDGFSNGEQITDNVTITGNIGYSFDEIGWGFAGANGFGGNIQEIILYTTKDLTDRIAIESDINNYFNIYP